MAGHDEEPIPEETIPEEAIPEGSSPEESIPEAPKTPEVSRDSSRKIVTRVKSRKATLLVSPASTGESSKSSDSPVTSPIILRGERSSHSREESSGSSKKPRGEKGRSWHPTSTPLADPVAIADASNSEIFVMKKSRSGAKTPTSSTESTPKKSSRVSSIESHEESHEGRRRCSSSVNDRWKREKEEMLSVQEGLKQQVDKLTTVVSSQAQEIEQLKALLVAAGISVPTTPANTDTNNTILIDVSEPAAEASTTDESTKTVAQEGEA